MLKKSLYVMSCLQLVTYVAAVAPNLGKNKPTDVQPAIASRKQQRYAEAAFDHLKNTNCSDALYMSDRDCEYIRTLDASDVNVYLAGPVDTRDLRVVVQDDNLDDDDSHNGVLVLDPYPQANFGHLVVIFYIDYAIDREWCYQQRGIVGEQIIHPLATFQ